MYVMEFIRERNRMCKHFGCCAECPANDVICGTILDSESGTSLKASGWKCVGQAGGLRWTGKRRPEVDLYPAQMKNRWEKEAN